jgi:ADP-ribosylglycohydrolase
MSRERQLALYPELTGQSFLFGKGMISDDTEHTCMVAQALIVAAGDGEKFAQSLAWRLRFWGLGLPASVGFATLRAICKLWLGFSPRHSGVFSAGNGPAMRSAVLGVCCGDDPVLLRRFVQISTRITHTDPKAEYGALAVALAAHMASRQSNRPISPDEYWQRLQNLLSGEGEEFLSLMRKVVDSVAQGESARIFMQKLGLERGVSGYIYHTVPVVIQVWIRNPTDYKSAISEIIRCGGDTDTTAAILGGIVGASVGENGIPYDWLADLWEWPRSVVWMRMLAHKLQEVCTSGQPQKSLPLPLCGVLLRNMAFLAVVLLHGFRRLLPPYFTDASRTSGG